MKADRARQILDEDQAYLEALAEDPVATKPPRSRATPAQRQIHQANVVATAPPVDRPGHTA